MEELNFPKRRPSYRWQSPVDKEKVYPPEPIGLEGVTGGYRGKVHVKASVIFGSDPNAAAHTLRMEGFIRIREWPTKGYNRRVLPDGRVQVDLEMVESEIVGQIESFEVPITIKETTANRNVGTLTQIVAGFDFPAEFHLARLVLVETPLGRMHNKEPIQIHGVLNSIPPISDLKSLDNFNTFHAVSDPVPLYNDSDEVVGYFGTSMPCSVRMSEAESE